MAEVVTGEAVVLDLAVARFPSRLLAQLIDVAVQLPVIVFLYVVIDRKAAAHLNQASAAAAGPGWPRHDRCRLSGDLRDA